jgi:hypothetical protein
LDEEDTVRSSELVVGEGTSWEGNVMERGEGEDGVNGLEEIEHARESGPPQRWRCAGIEKVLGVCLCVIVDKEKKQKVRGNLCRSCDMVDMFKLT